MVGFTLTGLLAAVACATPTIAPGRHEPTVARGPSELGAGLCLRGGAYIVGCLQRPRGPFAGTLRATSTARPG